MGNQLSTDSSVGPILMITSADPPNFKYDKMRKGSALYNVCVIKPLGKIGRMQKNDLKIVLLLGDTAVTFVIRVQPNFPIEILSLLTGF